MGLKDTIFNRFFTRMDKKQDQNQDSNGKGTLERYVEIVGEDYDDNIYPLIRYALNNLIVAETLLDRYVTHREDSLGNDVLFLSPDLIMRRRIIRFWHRFVSIKGTIRAFEVLFAMLGITVVISENFDTGGFDSATTFDSDTRPTFDSGKCSPCTSYEMELTGPALTEEIYNAIFSIIEFNEPINAILLALEYNGLDLLAVVGNWSYDTEMQGQSTPIFTNSGTVLFFFFEGNQIISNAPAYTYTQAGVKTVDVYIDDFLDIDAIDLSVERVSGVLDLSGFTVCASFLLNQNPELTAISFGASSAIIMEMDVSLLPLVVSFNFSGFSSLGGIINLSQCPALVGLLFNGVKSTNPTTFFSSTRTGLFVLGLEPLLFGNQSQILSNSMPSLTSFSSGTTVTTNTIDLVECRNNAVLTTFTISNLQGRIRKLNFSDCPLLTTLVFGAVVRGGSTKMYGFDCTSLVAIDTTTFNISEFDFHGCTSLTTVTHPAASSPVFVYDLSGCTSLGYFSLIGVAGLLGGVGASVDLSNCGFSGGEVDSFLADFVTICVTNRGETPPGSFSGRSLDLGGTNGAAGAGGIADAATLTALGITVTHN